MPAFARDPSFHLFDAFLRRLFRAARLLGLMSWFVGWSHAHAEPWLRVRAQVSIELHTANTATGMRLVGTLRDDLGLPLTNRELTAYFDAQELRGPMHGRVARTDDNGRFAMPIPCSLAGACRATIEFDGDPYHERAAVTQVLESQRAELQLDIVEPQALALSLDAPDTQVAVRATSSVSGVGGGHVHVVLENELARLVGTGTTGPDGSLRMQVDSARLGEPGLGELIVRSDGDAARTAARSSKPVLRTRATQTTLRASFDRKRQLLQLAVQLRTSKGPIAQRVLGVFAAERHVATLVTDARGNAERALTVRELGLPEGPQTLSARFDSDLPGLTASRSRTVDVVIEPVPRPNSAWLIAPALASIAFTIWSARRAQRRTTRTPETAERTAEVRLGAEFERAPTIFTISGRVEDVDSRLPLAAVLRFASVEQQAEKSPQGTRYEALQARADGEFATGPLASGSYRVRVLCPGYEAAAFELTLPHQGAGSNLRIALRSLRMVALETYADVAGRAVPAQKLAQATVRETMTAAMSGGRAGPGFAPLARSVEQIAYARAIPFEGDLLELDRHAKLALDEIAQRAQPPTVEDTRGDAGARSETAPATGRREDV